jgi:Flp pilus assembly CpaF family ATPase
LRFKLPKLKVSGTKHERLAHPTIAEHRVHSPAQSHKKYIRDAYGVRLPFFGRDRQMEAPVYRTVKTIVQHVNLNVHDPVPIPRPGRADDDLTHMFAINDYLKRSNARSAEKSVRPVEAAPVQTLRGSIMTARLDGSTRTDSRSEGPIERL